MSNIQRICPNCGAATPVDGRFCPQCGHDAQAGFSLEHASFPVTLSRAALPVLAGAATLALRAGWKLLNSRLTQAAAENRVTLRPAQPPAHTPESPLSSRRRIRIRSAWAVGDANGNWRQGASEHIIDFDD